MLSYHLPFCMVGQVFNSKLKVTFKKSTFVKFVVISILNLILLKIIMFFSVLSVSWVLTLRRIISPSSWYEPI